MEFNPFASVSKDNDAVAYLLDELAKPILVGDADLFKPVVVETGMVGSIEVDYVQPELPMTVNLEYAKEKFDQKLKRIEYILYRGMDSQQVKSAIRDIRTVLLED